MKTNDTYMKFSWLTVSGKAMNKEHNCIVKHENNKKGVDQYILFPPIKKGMYISMRKCPSRKGTGMGLFHIFYHVSMKRDVSTFKMILYLMET
jgi:hypothetical protein